MVGVMEILSVMMVVTGALVLAQFAAFVRVRFFEEASRVVNE
jgi:hypothetical protein